MDENLCAAVGGMGVVLGVDIADMIGADDIDGVALCIAEGHARTAATAQRQRRASGLN